MYATYLPTYNDVLLSAKLKKKKFYTMHILFDLTNSVA